jgi:hypothetical protein
LNHSNYCRVNFQRRLAVNLKNVNCIPIKD